MLPELASQKFSDLSRYPRYPALKSLETFLRTEDSYINAKLRTRKNGALSCFHSLTAVHLSNQLPRQLAGFCPNSANILKTLITHEEQGSRAEPELTSGFKAPTRGCTPNNTRATSGMELSCVHALTGRELLWAECPPKIYMLRS